MNSLISSPPRISWPSYCAHLVRFYPTPVEQAYGIFLSCVLRPIFRVRFEFGGFISLFTKILFIIYCSVGTTRVTQNRCSCLRFLFPALNVFFFENYSTHRLSPCTDIQDRPRSLPSVNIKQKILTQNGVRQTAPFDQITCPETLA
jgi:hypothetical protein